MWEELKTYIKVARVCELEKNLQEMEIIHQMESDTFNAQYENRKAFLLTKLNVSVTRTVESKYKFVIFSVLFNEKTMIKHSATAWF